MSSRMMLSRAVSKMKQSLFSKTFAVTALQRRTYASVANSTRINSAFSTNPNMRITTLENGLVVATETIPHSQTATVGVWIDAGSRAETTANNGSAHFLEHMAFKGTKHRTQHELETEVENMGGHLNAYTSREQTVYYAKSFRSDVPKAVNILSDILQNSTLDFGAIERERDVILREQEEVEKQTEEVVFDHLHATAFQGSSLGLTILGPEENIRTLKRDDLAAYITKNYTGDRMVLAAAGGVDHEQLVAHAKESFGNLRNGNATHRFGNTPSPAFVGSEIRVRDDTMAQAHIALAVEGVGWNSPDYFTMLVMQTIIGSWDRTHGAANHIAPRLSHISAKHNLCNSYMSFNTAYTDTGLFGIYLITENYNAMDDLIHHTLNEWSRLKTAVPEGEVERAKQQLKASLLLCLDGTTAIAEDIGRQMITSGKRVPPAEIAAGVDAVTAMDVQRAASQYLWNRDVAVVGMGQIDGLPDYKSIRSAMSGSG